MKIKHIATILSLFLLLGVADSFAQMTTWQMNNYKKLEKDRKKRAKTKGPKVNTKAGKHKASKKFRGGKTLFSKKRYDIGYLQPIDAPKYLALRRVDYISIEY